MSIENAIVDYLRERNRRGITYSQMERELGVARSYIHGLVNGANDPGGITLRMLQKLFPSARIELEPTAAGIGSDSSVALSNLDRRALELDARERELEAERRELAAVRRELDAERRLLELEREVRPPAPPGVVFSRDPHAPYHISGAKSTSFLDKEK